MTMIMVIINNSRGQWMSRFYRRIVCAALKPQKNDRISKKKKLYDRARYCIGFTRLRSKSGNYRRLRNIPTPQPTRVRRDRITTHVIIIIIIIIRIPFYEDRFRFRSHSPPYHGEYRRLTGRS